MDSVSDPEDGLDFLHWSAESQRAMKKLLFSLLLTLSLPCFAADQSSPTPKAPSSEATAETKALAEELLTVLQVEKSMEGSLGQVRKVQEQAKALLGKPDGEPAADKKEGGADMLGALLGGQMTSWKTIKPMMVDVYASTFTADELRGMIAFFKTPVGQKWIEKQPEVQEKTMQKMQELIMSSQPQIMDLIKQFQPKPQSGE